ncbi:MAG: methyltransferase [Clostridia bacterium]|nr:methyltransferase [Clostridia bacterium]
MKTNLGKDFYLCDLQYEGLFCYQRKNGYGFTTDAVLLANFIQDCENKRLVEFCSGSGVISILVNAKKKPKEIYCVEIQKELADMNEKSLEFNKIKNIKVICDSLENFASCINDKFDVVLANPPYYKVGAGRLPVSVEKRLSRFEVKTNIMSLVSSAKKVLNENGKLYLVFLTERENELNNVLSENGLKVIRKQYVRPKATEGSHIFLVEAGLNYDGEEKLLPDIIVTNADGSETEQIKEIYGRKPT